MPRFQLFCLCYSALVLDTGCLAKDEDGVWYPGTVVDVLDDHQYKVMFDTTHSVISVSIEDIIPSGEKNSQYTPPPPPTLNQLNFTSGSVHVFGNLQTRQ